MVDRADFVKSCLEFLRRKEIYLFGFVVFSFFYGMGSYGLFNNNEGIYAQISREMLESASFFIPTIDGLPYLEKPPLFYWLLTCSFQILGVSTEAARLVPSLIALITCILVYSFVCHILSPRIAFFSVFILSTSLVFIVLMRVVFFEGLLTLCMTGSLLSFYLWATQKSTLFLRIFYIFCALAVLAKGFVSLVLIVIIALFWTLWTGAWKDLFKTFDPLGMALFLGLALPWHIGAFLQNPFFWDFYIVNEHILRFLGLREPKDYYQGGVFYYLPRIFLTLFPWTLFLPLILKTRSFLKQKDEKDKSFLTFLFISLVSSTLFFTVSRAKANYYLLIMMPFLAILLAYGLDRLLYLQKKKSVIGIVCFISILNLSLLGVGFFFLDYWKGQEMSLFPHLSAIILLNIDPRSLIYGMGKELILTVLVIFAGGWCVVWARLKLSWALSLLCLSQVAFMVFFFQLLPLVEPLFSSRQMTVLIPQNEKAYFYNDYEELSSVLFYYGRRMPVIESVSEDLLFGSRQPEAEGWMISEATFREQAKKATVYVFLQAFREPHFLEQFKDLGFQVVSRQGRVVLVRSKARGP